MKAVEGKETGRGHSCRGSAQARLKVESGGYESDATQIAGQILAKLKPELRQSRDPKRRPPTPGPQRVCSAERAVTPPGRKDPLQIRNEKNPKRLRGAVRPQETETDLVAEMDHHIASNAKGVVTS